ncbi:hypothetical protein I545_4405 [Mycobacterium kansasii 662]|uniref:Uncharacterized protein n=2 Tax=Mycobacterium kansasii TaxID=1768 RepID=A0A653F077_MYCKA|nr:hypothetical protein I545_4405 [Mycobacterium kansasii 662]KEP44356.1 hypothetical protein MKSMC1_04900 [Mycobacterium kansasii]VAZ58389.1 hypothetical protein LAUMK22_00177 [Mycobacterium kansasii]VAZ64785.1 hypothetical protein LAUMK40_00906 [Mycobacterium kansasii]VAZ71418.1 hypothetical protein LAUMK7_00796 [Mycobacterium kansasii]
MDVVILQLLASRRVALLKPGIECDFLRAEIFCGPVVFIIENCFHPVPLLMHFPKDGCGPLREAGDVYLEPGIVLYNSLLEHIDTAVTKRSDAVVEMQKFRRGSCDIYKLCRIVLAIQEFRKRHYPQVPVPSISLNAAMFLNRRDSDSWTETCAFAHRARMRDYLY